MELTVVQVEGYFEANPPSMMEVRLRNAGPVDVVADSSGFRLIDEANVVHPETAPTCFGSRTCFPRYLTLHPGEQAQGWVRFGGISGDGPSAYQVYRLVYDIPGARTETTVVYPPGPVRDSANATARLGEWIRGDLVDLRLVAYGDENGSWNWTLDAEFHNGTTPLTVEMRFPWNIIIPSASGTSHHDSPKYRPYPGVSVKALLYRQGSDPSQGATPQSSVNYSWAWDA
jgi:hypothetical protein